MFRRLCYDHDESAMKSTFKPYAQHDDYEPTTIGLLRVPPEVWLGHYPLPADSKDQAAIANLGSSCKQAYAMFTPV